MYNPNVGVPMMPMYTPQGVALPSVYDVNAVRRFLREAGVPEDHLYGTWDEMRGYVRGRLAGYDNNR